MTRLVRYIAGTRDKYLYLRVGKNYNKLVGYTDTDWAGDCTTRKSTSCAIVMWGDCVLHVHCRRQSVYGLSSPEAEYYGCCGVAAELLYLQSMLSDMGYNVDLEVHTDASGAKALASRQGLGRVRHVENTYLWLQDKVAAKQLKIMKIRGDQNCADVGTKHVSKDVLTFCDELVGWRDWSPRQFPLDNDDNSD